LLTYLLIYSFISFYFIFLKLKYHLRSENAQHRLKHISPSYIVLLFIFLQFMSNRGPRNWTHHCVIREQCKFNPVA